MMNSQKLPICLMLSLLVVVFVNYPPTTAAESNITEAPSSAVQAADPSPRLVLEAGDHCTFIRELLFTADGRELVSVSDIKTMRILSVSPDGRQAAFVRTIRGQIEAGRTGMFATAALSPPDANGRLHGLAVAGYLTGPSRDRNAIRLHDYASGEVRALMRGHIDNVRSLAFSPSGRWYSSVGKDRMVRLWDLSALEGKRFKKAPSMLTGHADRIKDLAWFISGDWLAPASFDHTADLQNTAKIAQDKANVKTRLAGHTEWLLTLAFHPDRDILSSGGKDCTIRHWQSGNGKAREVFARAKHKVSALAFSPDERLVVSGNFSPPKPKRLTLFADSTGKTQQVFTGHDNVVMATAFHPVGRWVASGVGDHKEILLWSAGSGEILSRLEGRGRTIFSVAFSKDGRYINWGQTSNLSTVNNRGPLEHRFDLGRLERLEVGFSYFSAVRAQERVGKISLARMKVPPSSAT